MNNVTQSIIKEMVMNGTKLYKHSFTIKGYGVDSEVLLLNFEFILQDKKPLFTKLGYQGNSWQVVLQLLQNRYKYLFNVTGSITAEDDSWKIELYNFNELAIGAQNIMVKSIGFYTWGNDIGNSILIDEDDYTPDLHEEIVEYGVYDINTGETIFEIEL